MVNPHDVLYIYLLNELKKLTSSLLIVVIESYLDNFPLFPWVFIETLKLAHLEWFWFYPDLATNVMRFTCELLSISALFEYMTDRLIKSLFTINIV